MKTGDDIERFPLPPGWEDGPSWYRPVDVERATIFSRLLEHFEKPGKAIDLATATGMFAVIAADRGWDVTAVDAWPREWADTRITWGQEDVRNTDLEGYDLILCLGIFYHLTYEDQCNLLDRAAGTPMILDTHFGTDILDTSPAKGINGWTFHEKDGPWPDPNPWGAVGNTESFWPDISSLMHMLSSRGWTVMMEPQWMVGRSFFLCLPDGE